MLACRSLGPLRKARGARNDADGRRHLLVLGLVGIVEFPQLHRAPDEQLLNRQKLGEIHALGGE